MDSEIQESGERCYNIEVTNAMMEVVVRSRDGQKK